MLLDCKQSKTHPAKWNLTMRMTSVTRKSIKCLASLHWSSQGKNCHSLRRPNFLSLVPNRTLSPRWSNIHSDLAHHPARPPAKPPADGKKANRLQVPCVECLYPVPKQFNKTTEYCHLLLTRIKLIQMLSKVPRRQSLTAWGSDTSSWAEQSIFFSDFWSTHFI